MGGFLKNFFCLRAICEIGASGRGIYSWSCHRRRLTVVRRVQTECLFPQKNAGEKCRKRRENTLDIIKIFRTNNAEGRKPIIEKLLLLLLTGPHYAALNAHKKKKMLFPISAMAKLWRESVVRRRVNFLASHTL